MINKTIVGILLISFLLLFVNGVLGYTIKIPVCTSNSTANDTCISYTNVGAVTNAPKAVMYLGEDGNLYLTNDTQIQYTIVNNYTNYTTTNAPVYQVTNITNVTYVYYYNATNGSTINITIVQNISANETYLRQWASSFNVSSLFNLTGYNKSEADAIFAFKGDLNNVQSALVNYATQAQMNALDAKYAPILSLDINGPNGTKINFTAIEEHINNNESGMSMTWKVIIIINSILVVLLILLIAKNMMAGE